MSTILVTGGHGFIGRHTMRELKLRGHNPVAFDRRGVPDVELEFEQIVGDIRDANGVNEAVAHCDGIIHLGGILGTQETIQNPLPAAETNIYGGLNVLQAATQFQVPMVNIAVGNFWMNNTYSISKNSVERFATMYANERGTKVNNLRVMNAYGPGQSVAHPYGTSNVRKIMPSFICRALTASPMEVYDTGDQIMDMVYVKDVARDLVDLLEWEEYGETFECGTGRRTTVREIAEVVGEEVYRQTGIATEIKFLPMRPGEQINSTVVANDPWDDVDGYLPLEKGVKRTVKWFVKNWLPTYDG